MSVLPDCPFLTPFDPGNPERFRVVFLAKLALGRWGHTNGSFTTTSIRGLTPARGGADHFEH